MSYTDNSYGTLLREYENICVQNEWNSLFQRIKNNSSMKMADVECSIARNCENRFKNTYREVVPYDFNRVILSKTLKNDTDYINGSNIMLHGRRYITTQYPDRKTIHLFWSMVWQSKTPGVIMLGKLFEDNSGSYFPKLNEEIIVFDHDNVEEKLYVIYTMDEISYDGFVQRKLRIDSIEMNESMELLHFEFWSWPDQGVPQCMKSFLTLLGITRQYNIIDSMSGLPIIHCSAGAGRTGTFCLIDIAIVIAEKDDCLDNVNIPELMEDLRCQRMGMIRSFAQLRFCYEAVIEAFKRYRDRKHTELDGSYLSSIGEQHPCINDNSKAPSSSCSEDAVSDIVMYIALSDDSEDMNENDDDYLDLSHRNSLESSSDMSDIDGLRLHRQEVLSQRKLKNQEKIALLAKHLKDNNLKRFRLISTVTSTSLTLFDELNVEYYKSMLIAGGAVLCMATFFWLKFSSFKCS